MAATTASRACAWLRAEDVTGTLLLGSGDPGQRLGDDLAAGVEVAVPRADLDVCVVDPLVDLVDHGLRVARLAQPLVDERHPGDLQHAVAVVLRGLEVVELGL